MAKAKKFKNLADLERYLQNTVANTVYENPRIKNVVAKEMSQAVVDVVYSAHEPEQYDRRMDEGGLSDERNVEITEVFPAFGSVYVKVENLTEGNDSMEGKFITDTIEKGYEVNWNNPNGVWSEPRPFIEETVERLQSNKGELKEAFKATLKDIGLDVK